MITKLARKTFQMVNIMFCSHDHLKRRDDLAAGRTVSRISEKSKVVPFAENQIGPSEKTGPDFPKPGFTAGAFQAVFMPASPKTI